MENLYEYIGKRIRDLRREYGEKGITQEQLALEMKTTPNTISRWEAGIYKPSAMDLHRLSRFFRVSISVFFPEMEDSRLQALLSATGDLDKRDFDELTHYAQFRKARQVMERSRKRGKK